MTSTDVVLGTCTATGAATVKPAPPARSPTALLMAYPNAYLREDQVLPHLPALHLRLTSQLDPLRPAPVSRASVRPTPAQAIAHLRSEAISLTYDAATKTLTADTPQAERITIS